MRFHTVGWGAVTLLLVTGTWLVQLRGWLSPVVLRQPAFWRSGIGVAPAWKLALPATMLLLSRAHDVAYSPVGARALSTHPNGTRARRRLMLMARVGAVADLGVVVAAARLVRS